MSLDGLDLTQPLSAILRESTKAAHDKIQHSSGAAKLLSGELSKESYVHFLMMLHHIYSALEESLDLHSTHPMIEPVYNPTLLRRAPALSADIATLLGVSESSWDSHPIHLSLLASPSKGMTAYVDRILSISNSGDPTPLVAHAYVRYLGDLSGGQNIRHILAKAYGLKETDAVGAGDGLEFYRFKELGSASGVKMASIGEMKRIKDWFRRGMDEGAGDDVQVKAAIAQEASAVFFYNGDLFNAIILDSPITALSSNSTHKNAESIDSTNAYNGFAVLVLTVVTAVSLAHFFVVLGGYSGPRGYAKLGAAAEQWLSGLWGTAVH